MLHDPDARSAIMRSIKSKNTKPELLVFREMRRRRIWFQPNYPKAVGSPDLARPRDRRAVFIDGDFWHGRELKRVVARYGAESTWAIKLMRNIERDREVDRLLTAAGWDVLRVWESDIRRRATRQEALDLVARFLTRRPESARTSVGNSASPTVHRFEPAERANPKNHGSV